MKGMVDVIRRHGLVAFMLALAVVSLFQAVAARGGGRFFGAALLLAAMTAAELERREMVAASVYLDAVRWGGVLGTLAFLLWE
jgi:hypothetical protein